MLDTSRTSRRHKNVLLTHASHQLLRQQVDQCCRDLHEVKIISTTRQSQGITNSGHWERIVLSCCCRLYIARYIWSTHKKNKKQKTKKTKTHTKKNAHLWCMSKRRKAMRGQTSEFSTYKITGYGVDHRIVLITMWKCCETHQPPSDPATARRFVTHVQRRYASV